ncbi:hypothetical protein [Enterovirga sp.]|uniref:hypothetical protein n=1 Tax=Enterovirga sp. TaxID=2026350 RepID=UPI002D08A8A0|nr:hypothetical protein [Enterovirga sp.]HMO29715.1 hypothetical protein [Enterovirga sp.]
MSSRRILSRGARATIAVAALYGLLLQAFLAGLALPDSVREHGVSGFCSPLQDEPGAPARHHQHDCCLLACASLPPPPGAASALVTVPRAAIVLAFARTAPPPARAPPKGAHSPRAPPAA